MHHYVVRGIERLALPFLGDHRHAAIVFIAHYAPQTMLAGNLPALEIESVPVAVFRRCAESAGVAVLLQPAHLAVVGDVAPDQVAASGAPGGTLGPPRAGPQTLDGGAADRVFPEPLVERDDVGVGIADGLLAAPIPLRLPGSSVSNGGRGKRRGLQEESSLHKHRFS